MAILAVVCTIATFALTSGRRILGWVSAGFWVITGVASYTASGTLWDIYYALFWLSMILVLVMSFVPAMLKEKKEEDVDMLEGIDDADRPLAEDIQKSEHDRDNYNRLFGKRKIGDKSFRPRRSSNFAKTGRIK